MTPPLVFQHGAATVAFAVEVAAGRVLMAHVPAGPGVCRS